MKAIIGYDKDQTILAAVILNNSTSEINLARDALGMLRSGLTVSVVECNKIIIGDKFDWALTKITKLEFKSLSNREVE